MRGIRWRIGAALIVAGAIAAGETYVGPSWSQPAPTVVQVPTGTNSAGGTLSERKGETAFQVTSDVSLRNGEGPITATLGDLLRSPDAAGLEKVRIIGRARGVSGSGTSIGQIVWTEVTLDDDGQKKAAPLANPLNSKFRVSGSAITASTKIKAEGDLEAVLVAARQLVKKEPKPTAKDDKKPDAKSPTQAQALGSQGASNDVAKSYQPLQAPQAAPQTTPPPPEPTLTVTSDGCSPRVDQAAGYVVIQTQTLANGQPSGQGCTDTADRIPIQKSYSGCPDLVQGDVAEPQYKLFWVATNGTTNFLGDCQPDTDTQYATTEDQSSCPAPAADLSALQWVTLAARVYTNHNNQKVVVSPCAPVSQVALQTGKDYSACEAEIDLTKGIATPEYKAWYLNPATQQQTPYTSCQPDTAAAVALQKDYSSCPAVVGSTSAQRQYQSWYTDTTGKRVNVGNCTTDPDSSMPIQVTYAGCSDYVDISKMTAWPQQWSFYFDAEGNSVEVTGCAPDTNSQEPLQQDYSVCPTVVNQAAGFAEDVYQLFYIDRVNTRQQVGSCTPDPTRYYIIKNDYSTCADSVDLANLKAYAQYTTYYLDIAGVSHPVNKQCTPDTTAFPIETDTSVCPYAVDTQHLTAQQQGQLYYLNHISARIMVRDCAPTSAAPIPVVYTATGCSMRDDFTNLIAIQQKKYQYTDAHGSMVDATGCADSSETYAMTAIYGVCPDLVLSDNSAAFKQIRYQISPPSGNQYVTDCQPSQAPGDTASAQTTTQGCETTFFHYIAQGQSFGAWRYYYQFSGGQPVYLTGCVQSTTVYPQQIEIQGYQYNDPQKTAQPKTAIYILPPIGRVDVSPAQVRDGAPNIAYTFEKTTYNAHPNSMFWVGCEAWQPTDQTDTYLRPDNTEVSYIVGAGPNADMGDQCTRLTQTQFVYIYSTVVGPIGSRACTPGGACIEINPGTVTNLGPNYTWCQAPETWTITITDYWQNQSRVATTLPAGAGGTTTYTAWQGSGAGVPQNSYSCSNIPVSGGGG
jgi:hypothetical protein